MTPDRSATDSLAAEQPAPLTPERLAPDGGDAAMMGPPQTALGELLTTMRSESAAVREAAWAACYERYKQVVWTRAFYVLRSIAWLREPGEEAADVTSDVFVGLPDAVKHYREEGKAKWWLKQIAVRTALRRKEELTGRWATGKKPSRQAAEGEKSHGERADHAATEKGRIYVSFDETVDQIVERLDTAEREELLELGRRRDLLRNSPDPTKRRWAEFLELYVAGYGFNEIGQRMGLTEASARNWLCKIRKYLAQPVDPAVEE